MHEKSEMWLNPYAPVGALYIIYLSYPIIPF